MSNPITSVKVNSLTDVDVTFQQGNTFKVSSPYDLKANNPEAAPIIDAALKDYDAQRSAQLADTNAAVAAHLDVLASHHAKLPKEVQDSAAVLGTPAKERRRKHLQDQIAKLQAQIGE